MLKVNPPNHQPTGPGIPPPPTRRQCCRRGLTTAASICLLCAEDKYEMPSCIRMTSLSYPILSSPPPLLHAWTFA